MNPTHLFRDPSGVVRAIAARALGDGSSRRHARPRGGVAMAAAACLFGSLVVGEVRAAPTLTFVPGPSGGIVEPSIPLPPKLNGIPIAGPNMWSAADLRGDGRKDLIVGLIVSPTQPTVLASPLRILRPKSDGAGFVDVTRALLGNGPLPSTEHVREIAVTDLNGDGREDVFVAAHGYDALPFAGERNSLMLSNGDATFTDASPSLPPQRDFSHSTAVGDVNGDGLPDIFVGNVSGSPPPYFLMGRPSGRFEQVFSSLPTEVLQVNVDNRFHASLLVDIDGDGHLDLVVGSGYAGESPSLQTVVYYNDGVGDFTRRPRTQFPFGRFGATATVDDIVALDVNDDGRMDLLVLTTQSGARQDVGMAVQVLVNQGNGQFTDESVARLGTSASRTNGSWWTFLRVADLDGDGRLDFYAFGYAQPGLDVPFAWLNNGDGTYSAVSGQPVFGREPVSVEAIDVDGDGRLDFVTVYSDGEGNIQYSTWLNRTPRTAPSEPVAVHAIAGDGRVGLVFKPPLGNGPQPVSGYTATCRSPTGVLRSAAGAASPIVVDGLVNGTRYTCTVRTQMGSVSGPASRPTVAQPRAGLNSVLEFYHSGLDHYFITWVFDEIAKLDAGTQIQGWTRTGYSFKTYTTAQAGTSPVCRYYIPPALGDSHFYGRGTAECDATGQNNPGLVLESPDFMHITLPTAGTCPAGTMPIYRVFSNRPDANHRYTTDRAVRDRMVARGWLAEGDGPDLVVMCAPQ